MMGPHKNLKVWHKLMELVNLIYTLTRKYPQYEIFGLCSQMQRAAVSIPSNIAEGYGRSSNKDLIHFLHNALGSSNELDTQIIISKYQGYITDAEFRQMEDLNESVNKMLSALIDKRKLYESAGTKDLKPQT